jgi:hypothetical protein
MVVKDGLLSIAAACVSIVVISPALFHGGYCAIVKNSGLFACHLWQLSSAFRFSTLKACPTV